MKRNKEDKINQVFRQVVASCGGKPYYDADFPPEARSLISQSSGESGDLQAMAEW